MNPYRRQRLMDYTRTHGAVTTVEDWLRFGRWEARKIAQEKKAREIADSDKPGCGADPANDGAPDEVG